MPQRQVLGAQRCLRDGGAGQGGVPRGVWQGGVYRGVYASPGYIGPVHRLPAVHPFDLTEHEPRLLSGMCSFSPSDKRESLQNVTFRESHLRG